MLISTKRKVRLDKSDYSNSIRLIQVGNSIINYRSNNLEVIIEITTVYFKMSKI